MDSGDSKSTRDSKESRDSQGLKWNQQTLRNYEKILRLLAINADSWSIMKIQETDYVEVTAPLSTF